RPPWPRQRPCDTYLWQRRSRASPPAPAPVPVSPSGPVSRAVSRPGPRSARARRWSGCGRNPPHRWCRSRSDRTTVRPCRNGCSAAEPGSASRCAASCSRTLVRPSRTNRRRAWRSPSAPRARRRGGGRRGRVVLACSSSLLAQFGVVPPAAAQRLVQRDGVGESVGLGLHEGDPCLLPGLFGGQPLQLAGVTVLELAFGEIQRQFRCLLGVRRGL